jgi:hypothetical protein
MKQSKYIHLIGGEIEGGWNYGREDLHEDLGIKMNGFKSSVCCGEAVITKPMAEVEDVVKWIEFNYKKYQNVPYDFKTNNGLETQEMCGTHWHFSFNSISEYVALMSPNFRKYFVEFMKNWGEKYPINNNYFWERLENKNKFCRDEFKPYDQIFLKKKIPNDPGRYSQLHYAYSLYRTIESRLMPTFVSMDTAISAFMAHIDCINSYLDANPPKPFNFSKGLELDTDEECEKKEIVINKKSKFNLFMFKGIVKSRDYSLDAIDKEAAKEDLIKPFYKGAVIKPVAFPNKKIAANNLKDYAVIYDNDPKPIVKNVDVDF